MKDNLIDVLPTERFLSKGPESLSDAELIAIILRTGTKNNNVLDISNQVLALGKHHRPGLLGLYDSTLDDLKSIDGVGEVKAIKLKALAEISMRMHRACAQHDFSVSSPESVADYFMEEMRHLENETVVLACLDTKGQLITYSRISTGCVNSSLISPRTIYIEALAKKAVFVILLHNHPSGDPSPSHDDIELTNRVKKVGDELEIPLLDHIIIGDNRYYSFQENGMFSRKERTL